MTSNSHLYVEEQVKKGFTPAPFVSLRSSYSLRADLGRAKVYLLLTEKGSSSWKSRYETGLNIKETNTF